MGLGALREPGEAVREKMEPGGGLRGNRKNFKSKSCLRASAIGEERSSIREGIGVTSAPGLCHSAPNKVPAVLPKSQLKPLQMASQGALMSDLCWF